MTSVRIAMTRRPRRRPGLGAEAGDGAVAAREEEEAAGPGKEAAGEPEAAAGDAARRPSSSTTTRGAVSPPSEAPRLQEGGQPPGKISILIEYFSQPSFWAALRQTSFSPLRTWTLRSTMMLENRFTTHCVSGWCYLGLDVPRSRGTLRYPATPTLEFSAALFSMRPRCCFPHLLISWFILTISAICWQGSFLSSLNRRMTTRWFDTNVPIETAEHDVISGFAGTTRTTLWSWTTVTRTTRRRRVRVAEPLTAQRRCRPGVPQRQPTGGAAFSSTATTTTTNRVSRHRKVRDADSSTRHGGRVNRGKWRRGWRNYIRRTESDNLEMLERGHIVCGKIGKGRVEIKVEKERHQRSQFNRNEIL